MLFMCQYTTLYFFKDLKIKITYHILKANTLTLR
jgi:hypothetical protein